MSQGWVLYIALDGSPDRSYRITYRELNKEHIKHRAEFAGNNFRYKIV